MSLTGYAASVSAGCKVCGRNGSCHCHWKRATIGNFICCCASKRSSRSIATIGGNRYAKRRRRCQLLSVCRPVLHSPCCMLPATFYNCCHMLWIYEWVALLATAASSSSRRSGSGATSSSKRAAAQTVAKRQLVAISISCVELTFAGSPCLATPGDCGSAHS